MPLGDGSEPPFGVTGQGSCGRVRGGWGGGGGGPAGGQSPRLWRGLAGLGPSAQVWAEAEGGVVRLPWKGSEETPAQKVDFSAVRVGGTGSRRGGGVSGLDWSRGAPAPAAALAGLWGAWGRVGCTRAFAQLQGCPPAFWVLPQISAGSRQVVLSGWSDSASGCRGGLGKDRLPGQGCGQGGGEPCPRAPGR